jgi:quercetin dioxygenase-like cupin family protein
MTGDTKVIVLSKSDLPGGMEATTFMTEIPPGSSTPRHYHPGQELAYVLEGTGVMHEIGKPSMPIKPGFTVTAYSPPDKAAYVHWASNTSKTDIQRWVITVVTPKEYPIRIQVPAFRRVPIARNDRRNRRGQVVAVHASARIRSP